MTTFTLEQATKLISKYSTLEDHVGIGWRYREAILILLEQNNVVLLDSSWSGDKTVDIWGTPDIQKENTYDKCINFNFVILDNSSLGFELVIWNGDSWDGQPVSIRCKFIGQLLDIDNNDLQSFLRKLLEDCTQQHLENKQSVIEQYKFNIAQQQIMDQISTTNEFSDMEIDMSEDDVELIINAYVRQHLAPASINLFNQQLTQTGNIGDALRQAIINDFCINAILDEINKTQGISNDE